jgi:Platelet-activating factor acetylhydrolase, isoform II
VGRTLVGALVVAVAALFATSSIWGGQSTASILPVPSGSFAIGRTGYDWTDQSRPEVLSEQPSAHRELMVYVWYPAAPSDSRGTLSPYLPGAPAIDKSAQADRSKPSSWALIVSGKIQTHIFENATMASTPSRFPLLVFSQGGGMPSFFYTSQIEELVSHGYIVASIEHTYENGAVVFPDGRVITNSLKSVSHFGPPPTGTSKEDWQKQFHVWEQQRVDVWAGDIQFVLDQLKRFDEDQTKGAPFSRRIDFSRVGAFGHSIGGNAVARACELDPRIKACANEDGYVDPDGPIVLYDGARLPKQPFLFIQAAIKRPTDEELTSWHFTREQFDHMIAGLQAGTTKELESCTGGSYQVVLDLPGFEHSSFTDLPLLQHVVSPADETNDLRSLQLVRSYLLAFFDKYFRGAKEPLLDIDTAKDPAVNIRRFGRARTN